MKRLLLSAALLLISTSLFAGPHVTHEFKSSAPLGDVRRVVVEIEAGDVTVRNGAAGTIAIRGTVARETDDDSEAKDRRIVNASAAEVYVGADEAIVRRKFGANAQGWRAQNHNTQWDVTIEVPAGVSVELGTKYGDVDIEGTFGNVDVDLRAGDLDVTTPRANVRELTASCRVGELHTNLGDEILDRAGLLPGKTHWVNQKATGTSVLKLHTTAGEVNVTLTQ